MRTLETPMRDLTKFINSAKKEALPVKSEEENRKIRELTALIQILNDLRATSVSIRCSPAFSAYSNSEDLFSNIINSVDTVERATASILILTQEHLVPELKEKSLLALKNLAKPLESIEKSFSAVLQVEGISRLTTEERNGLSTAMGDLVGIVSTLRKTVCAIDDARSVTIVEVAKPTETDRAGPSVETLVADLQPVLKEALETSAVSPTEGITREAAETPEKAREDKDHGGKTIDEVEKSLRTFDTSTVASGGSVIAETEDVSNEGTLYVEDEQDFQEQRAIVAVDREESLSISMQSTYVKCVENIIGPVQELRGSLSRMEEGQVALARPLEELEKSLRLLATRVAETATARDESAEESRREPFTLQRANVALVLEELQKSIATIEERVTLESVASFPSEITSVATTAEVALSLKKLRDSTATLQQLFDSSVPTVGATALPLERFAVLAEGAKDRKVDVDSQRQIKEENLARTRDGKDVDRAAATPSVGELREAIMDLAKSEIEETGTLQETGLAFALTKWVEPLEQLENTVFSVLDERSDAPFEGSSTATTTLEDLKTFVHRTEECLTIGRKKLSLIEGTESSSLMQKANESLEDLKTSIAIVRRSVNVEDSNERLSDFVNVPISALQDLAKTVEEVKRDCAVVFLEPKIAKALDIGSGKTTPIKENVAILEDVVSPIRLLRESIATIELGKTYETEEMKVAEEKKPASSLSTLVDPLQQLEKIFVAATHRERVILEETANLPVSEEGAKILSLSPVLEEMDRTLATIQEQVTLEGGAESASKSDGNTSQLMQTIAEPLVELRASIAAIQKVGEIASEQNLHELSDRENVSALETFAKSLYELAERIAVVDDQRAIFEPAADTMSEGASSLKTWADIAEDESPVKVTRAMTVEQGTVESPTEAVSPFSEEEDTMLRTLARPLDELREFLALVVEERRTTETTSPFTPKEDASLTKSIAKPLLELRNVAAMVIEEKLAIESAREKAFGEDGGPAMSIDPLIQPLEEVCNSIAIIQDQILVESLQEERPVENELAVLSVLAEPLLDLQRCILVLEERVISPDVEPLPQELSKADWTTKECVATTTLQEIEKSIAEICERVTAIQADTVKANEPSKITTQDRIIVEKLIEPVEGIISAISNVGEEMIPQGTAVERGIEYQALKTLVDPLKAVSVSFSLLRDEAGLNVDQEEANIEVIVESLSNLERCISIVEEQAIGKPLADPLYGSEVDKTVMSTLRLPLVELKRTILEVEDSPTEYLQNLEKPLKDLCATLETISTEQQNPTAVHSMTRHTLPSIEMTKLSIKLIDVIVGINESLESVEHEIRDQIGRADIDECTECEQLETFNAPLQELKKCMVRVQEEGTLEKERIMVSLGKIHESIATLRKQHASKSFPQSADIYENQKVGILQPLSQHLDNLDDTIASIEAKEDVTSERLEALEKPLRNLFQGLNDLRDKLLIGKVLWIPDDRAESREVSDTKERKDDKMKDTEKTDQVQSRQEELTDENLKKKETEKFKREGEEGQQKEEHEKLNREEEERTSKETERRKLEEEESKKKEEADKLKLEDEERKKKEEAEKLKLEEEERRKKEEAEKLKLEEEERRKKEKAEKVKLEEEERRKKEEAEKLKLEEEERKNKEEGSEKLKLEEEERKEKENDEKLKVEEVERGKKEDSEKVKLEEEERKKMEYSEKLKVAGKKEEEVAIPKREKEDHREEEEAGVEERSKREIEGETEDEEEIKSKDERKSWEQRKKKEEEKIRREEEEESRAEEDRRRKRKERRMAEEEETLRKEEAERLRAEEERRKRKEEAEQSRKDREERLKKQEMERLERRRAEERQRKEDFGRMRKEEEERMNIREKERQARREESARLLKEEEDRLRRRHEEELSAINKRRRERARDENWSRLRENESDRFLRSIDDERSRSSRLSRISPDGRSRFYRVDSDLQLESTLSDSSRSYSWRESLASSGRRSIDDYMDYKLRESSLNRSLYDVGSYYGTRRRREERINRARSISLLKYDEYYMGDTDSTLSYSSSSKPPRCGRMKIPSHIEYDDLDSSSFDSIVQDKGKKPSFCTRLTNRTVGEGMRTRLTCTVLGHPEPRVYWRKDGQELSPTSNKYQTRFDNGMAYFELNEARVEDSGVYTCIAENIHGSTSTESTLKVYRDFVPPLSPPTFTKSIRDTYRHSDHELALECRVRGYPSPTISWLKDGKVLDDARYTQKYLDDGIYRLEISNPDASDSGRYVCRATNEMQSAEMSHTVHFEGRDRRSAYRSRRSRIAEDDTSVEASRRPRFSNFLSDHSVPTGGTIALQVEVKGTPVPEVRWLHGERKEPISMSKAKTFTESGVHTLIVPEATESERGTYICRAVNAYGYVDTAATIEIISPGAIDGGKPAMFVSRPSEKSIAVAVGEDVSVSFRVTGVPKPRVTWMKGMKDITDGPRSYKEAIDDYVRLTLKRATPSDEGTYCILVKNRYGCDRSFFSIWIKQRARSLTPLPDWNRSDAGSIQNEDELSYIKDVPGPVSSEPVVVDGGKNWLSLSWGKAERRGPAPVIAYKVDAWLMGGDGGARWVELGVTPINALDAFNLRPGGEYRFRVTPRNRYGWGESVTTSNSFTVSEVVDLPEFIKILPGQLKALEGSTIKLECEIRGDPNINVKWYRETAEIDPNNDSRYSVGRRGLRCSLAIETIKEDDSGRYICEASNKVGKVSSFARVLVVTDPKIIEADEKLRSRILGDEREERPPQFAMRLRDRRVQVTYPVRLTCQIIGYPAPEIIWFKNAVEITQDERHVFWNDDSNFHTLEIIHSTLEDSGCYMVTAKNIHGSVSCRSILVVDKGIRAYVAPEFLYGLDAVYAVRLNDELRMSARIEAYPSVGVVWHRDGLRLRPSRRTIMTLNHDGTVELSLAKVTCRDAGVYSCTAINEVGRAETSTRVNVIIGIDEADDKQIESLIEGLPTVTIASPDVPYSKEPLFVTKPLSTEALEGDTVIILCEVVGDPKPEVIWLRDFLKPDYYRDAPHFRLVDNGPQYRLEIPHAKLDFTGTYSVIARNCHGEAKAIISLQIYAKGQGKETTMKKSPITHGKVLTLPMVTRELRDIRCCDGDAVTLECKFLATPERPNVRWEKGGKVITMGNDFTSEFDGEVARLSIQHVYPEDEGEYTCVAYNELGKAFTSACLVVDVPEGKENVLSERLSRPVGLLSAGSTPRSTPRSTPIRSLSPAISHGRELRSPQFPPRRGSTIKRPKISPPKFYSVPHNRVVEEGETVRFQCAVVGHPTPWLKWDKNGIVVTPTARISIVEKDDVKILEIGEVTQEDAGLYRVTLENDFGRIEASARLEVINRHGSYGRTIRTRSASPRIHPSFSRSLLDTTTRMDGRLRLQCGLRGTPSPTPTWYRNGRPLPRSNRIKRHFDGKTAKIEISKVKASDAGEYACVATNVLGSARNTCQVTVLDPHDSSTLDKEPPKFLQSLPEESIVMEGNSYELRTKLAGTPPFSINWLKDKREIPDDDLHNYVSHSDGGISLRLSDAHPRDAGEYACIVRNEFGETSCGGLLAVQDYKAIPNLAPRFTKTPLTRIVSKGETACFCARVQCGKPMNFSWTINGKDARDNARCKIEIDENVSILKIRDVSSRDTGEIRCTASVLGNGPSICCTTELRLNRVSCTSENRTSNAKKERKISHNREKSPSPSFNRTPDSKLFQTLSSSFRRSKKEQHFLSTNVSHQKEERFKRTRSSSLPLRTKASSPKRLSPLPKEKNAVPSTDLHISKTKKNESNEIDVMPFTCVERSLLTSRTDNECIKVDDESSNELDDFVAAAIVKAPTDVKVFRGNKLVLRITYRGHPEPLVKWFRAGRELRSEEKIGITYGAGVSHLTLDDITADHAGKYEVSVENLLALDRQFFSLAVEGPPDPPTGTPSVTRSKNSVTIAWRSPAYDGGCTITGYTIEMNRREDNSWTVIAESCHSLSHTVLASSNDSIVAGESYRFRVRGENIHGVGEPSARSELVRIPREGETILQNEEEEEFAAAFEARTVHAEDSQSFVDRYDVFEELGKGRYGVVKRVVEKSSNESFAAKFVRTIKSKDREQVREEINIMNRLRHPKLLLLAAAFEGPREIIMVTEYISGGELFERVVADDFTLTERDSMLFMRQICEGVEYMHKNNVVHLDLKPENIMCRTRTSHKIKLIDFGLAQTLKPDTPIRVLFGTPEFIPPEIISYEPIGTESDMWSVGVICYVLLTGLSPFMGDNDAETFANITRADYDLDDEAFDAISNDAKDFITGLLVKRKESRMSSRQCLEHPWMAQHAESMSRVALPTDKLKKFIVRRKWQVSRYYRHIRSMTTLDS
ncbi:titin-like isoform X2 [Vespula pensylvanica]|uniref:titin-like isoform X2 n=1 Tax=Vespula pensylvanica TaxID=30213 RepID=UPI001CB9DB23|nr:titin-like isoform X2 [Vespula pensylvanica]